MKQYCPHLTTSIYPCKACSETAQSNIQVSQLENQLKACRVLIKEQDEKIVELATELEYANQTIEQFRFVLRNLALATSKKIDDLEEQLKKTSEK